MRGRRPWVRIVALLVAVGGLALLSLPAREIAAADKAPAAKGAAAELPKPLTREAIRELVARLSDEEVRQLLLTQLDKGAEAAAEKTDKSMAAGLAGDMDRARTEVGAVLRSWREIPAAYAEAIGRFSEGRASNHLLLVAVLFAAMIAVAWLAERLVGWLLAGVRARMERGPDGGNGSATIRVLLDVLLLGVFIITAVGVFLAVYQGHEPSRELVVRALLAVIQARLLVFIARWLLAPRDPARRLLPFDDAGAHALYQGLVVMACLYAFLDVQAAFLLRHGTMREPLILMTWIGRLVFVATFIRLVWKVRAPIAAHIRGNGRSAIRRVLADLWPALMTAYTLGLLVIMTVEQLAGRQRTGRAGVLSLLVVIGMPIVGLAFTRLIERRAARAGAGSGTSFVPVLRKGVHIVVTVVGLLVIVDLWNLDLMGFATRGVGAWVAGALVNVALTLLLAYLVWQLAKTAIDRRLEREHGPQGVSDLGEAGGTGASRLRTLLPLARGTIFGVVVVMSAMTVLAALGVNIGPLLAGAGVVGLAIGFGAQTLVRDIISGAFYLMDDAFRIGEYINVGDAKGTVERIGIRSMQLRHHRGPLNIVPYGGIKKMTNESRDWVVEKLEFRLTYDTDITKVKKIVKRIGQELAADPDLGPHILQPLKSQGVLAMEDSALLVKAKFVAKPGEQFVIRREAYQRLKQAFDDAGIHFAHRQVTVFVPPGTSAATAAAVAGAAAAGAIETPPAEEPPG